MRIKNRREFEIGIIYTLLSASCFSIFGMFIKIGLEEVSVWSLTFFRFLVPLLLSLPFLWWSGTLKDIFPLKDLRLQVLRSLAVVIGQFSMIYYLTKASILDATLMWGTGPIFIPLIASLFYHVKIPRVTWISIFISFLGVGLILKPNREIFDPFIIFGLISGVAMAVSQTLYGVNSEKGKPGENLFFLFFFCSLFTLVPFILAEESRFDLGFDRLKVVSVMGVALSTIGNQLFRGKAYQRAQPAILTPFLYVSVVVSAFFDWALFHLYPDAWTAVGFILILAGSLLKWAWGRGLA